jgi:PKD repeat protein
MSLQDRVAHLQRSISARLAGLTARSTTAQRARDARPCVEALEDRMLLSATLLVDAGADVNSDEGSQVSFNGTFEDTDAGGGGTPGVFDVLQLTSTGDDEQQMDTDGDRAVWVSNSDIFFFDGTFDAVTLAPNIINLTSTLSSNASDPHISGDHIVYAGGGIKAYNIVTGVTTTLASGFSVANPEIDGDIAVWTERPGSFFNITMADLSAATPVPIAVFPVGSGPGATGNQLDPKISGDNIIWLAPGVGGFNDVFIHNLTTGITTNVSNSAAQDTGHQIDDGVVVWSNSVLGDSDVYVFDGRGFDGTGTAPTAINLGAAGVSDVVPKVSGANIVWDGNAEVYLYNLDTAVTTQLTSGPATFLTEPDISGSNVVWSTGNEILLYNIDTELTTNLSNSSRLDSQALVSGNNVFWLGRASIAAANDVFFASGQAEPPTYTIDWDFGDGTVLSDTTLAQDHTYADNGTYTVTLTVTASDGRVTTDTLTAIVDNVAPDVAPITGDSQGLRGQTLSFSSSFTDPGTLDTHTTSWAVTDSLGAVVATGTGTSFEFTPDEAGSFEVTFTVTDNDGGVGEATFATESKVLLVVGGELQIAGTNGRDIIFVKKSNSTPGALQVTIHELDNNTLTVEDGIASIDTVVIDGRAGDDLIKVFNNIGGNVNAYLYGGDGNDGLRGGDGDDFISGGDGIDLIGGGDGRDFLIGGLGSDLVLGNDHDDILVGGVYTQDRDRAAVSAILSEWTRTDLNYTGRVANLTNGTGLNGSHVLNNTNVFDDNEFDILMGMQGLDWFHANDSQDLTDQRRNELLTESEIDFVDVDVDYVV